MSKGITLDCFGDKPTTKLRRVFTWLTHNGMGPRFGSRSIAWYQAHQCAAIDILQVKAGRQAHDPIARYRVRNGLVECQAAPGWNWIPVSTPNEIYTLADRSTRS